jgi:hypothetical protein
VITVYIRREDRAVLVSGHGPSEVCGCLTALMRAYSIGASRAVFRDGLSMVEIKPEFEEDFKGLLFGVMSIAYRAIEDVEVIPVLNTSVSIAYRDAVHKGLPDGFWDKEYKYQF